MRAFLVLMIAVITSSTFAKVADSAELGCQLYLGEQKVFHDLRKFNIGEADGNGVRVLDAYLAEKEGIKGTCTIAGETLGCIVKNSKGKTIEVFIDLDGKSTGEVEGEVVHEGLIFARSHQVSCDILNLK
ncbi:hypothetical protein [Bacteriovorax sp. Seq25_V]|uniref:hypothetical protein n=1 Tax=Bacteriovorax sp. Seq25_V TaxID=1201288 RepID=UPI000389EA2A|nr:hypothetical protein [Bacteriovorax sp. Seq25_V]EQC48052.1 hypothetical protein M900_1126 [Bacteriovorax sp. Seq25_V]